MTLPDGVQRRTFDGERRLATRGATVYGEPSLGDWRLWDAGRSKLGAALELGVDVGLEPDSTVLYLGAASGTTVSHVADAAGPTYAVEFAPRPAADLVSVAEDRDELFPLLKDARQPAEYGHVVESNCDLLVQDVATRDQAAVAVRNARFLADDGELFLAIKARSEDVTASPEAVFDRVLDDLTEAYDVVTTERLEPYHDDHLAVLARPA